MKRSIFALMLTFLACACGSAPPSTADSCHENSDCLQGLICALGACRSPCSTAADCAAGDTCDAFDGGSACVAPPSASSSGASSGSATSGSSSGTSSGAPYASGTPSSYSSFCCTPADPTAAILPCGGTIGGHVVDWTCGTAEANGKICWACQTVGGACNYLTYNNVPSPGTVTACPSTCTVDNGMVACPMGITPASLDAGATD